MRIAIVGPGAMGMLFAGYLSKSKEHEIFLIGRDKERMDLIKNKGLIITEKDGTQNTFNVNATIDSKSVGEVDLFVLLTKSTVSKQALDEHISLIGKNTILMTLQNGGGHDTLLKQYTKEENIALGTTLEGSSITTPNEICHSGIGPTVFSMLNKDNKRIEWFATALQEASFEANVADDIKYLIWHKVLMNASSSVVSGLLQMPQGYCVEDEYAWNITKQLILEAIYVAGVDGIIFDEEEQLTRIRTHLVNGRKGLVSLYADLRDGRNSEVDNISGFVARRAKELGVLAPTHDALINLVHAYENKKNFKA